MKLKTLSLALPALAAASPRASRLAAGDKTSLIANLTTSEDAAAMGSGPGLDANHIRLQTVSHDAAAVGASISTAPCVNLPRPYILEEGPLVPDHYTVVLTSNYTFAKHWRHIGVNLANQVPSLWINERNNSYQGVLPSELVHSRVRMDPGVQHVRHSSYLQQPPVDQQRRGERRPRHGAGESSRRTTPSQRNRPLDPERMWLLKRSVVQVIFLLAIAA